MGPRGRGRCRFKDALRVPAAGAGMQRDVTAPPRGSMLQQRRAGGGRAGTPAAHGAGRSPASERDASCLQPQVPPSPPAPPGPRPCAGARWLRPQGDPGARSGRRLARRPLFFQDI